MRHRRRDVARRPTAAEPGAAEPGAERGGARSGRRACAPSRHGRTDELALRGRGLRRRRATRSGGEAVRAVHDRVVRLRRNRARARPRDRQGARRGGGRRQPARAGRHVLDPDSPVKLLVVEDEERVASFLVKGLSANGYGVEWVSTGRNALRRAADPDVSLVILDLGLPDLDGLEVLGSLRKRGATVPVLVLSARGRVNDRVKGLDLGADDYLAKPFAFEELLARI